MANLADLARLLTKRTGLRIATRGTLGLLCCLALLWSSRGTRREVGRRLIFGGPVTVLACVTEVLGKLVAMLVLVGVVLRLLAGLIVELAVAGLEAGLVGGLEGQIIMAIVGFKVGFKRGFKRGFMAVLMVALMVVFEEFFIRSIAAVIAVQVGLAVVVRGVVWLEVVAVIKVEVVLEDWLGVRKVLIIVAAPLVKLLLIINIVVAAIVVAIVLIFMMKILVLVRVEVAVKLVLGLILIIAVHIIYCRKLKRSDTPIVKLSTPQRLCNREAAWADGSRDSRYQV